MTTTIHFVRHGTVHNPSQTFYGRLPHFRLSEQGQAEAAALKPYFAERPLAHAFVSPLLRTRQTARAFLNGRSDVPVTYTSDLLEVYVPYEGQPLADMEAKRWDIYSGNLPPYETPADIFVRIHRFVIRTLAKYQGQELVAVTHADVILFLSLWARGYEPVYANKALVEKKELTLDYPQPASISTFTWENISEKPILEYRRVS